MGMTRLWHPWVERIHDIGNPTDVHIWRLHLLDWPLRIYLHHIRLPDNDRHLHNHPRQFHSVVLLGAYTELLDDSSMHRHTAGHMHRMGIKQFHKIVSVEDHTWTLFIAPAKKTTEWGFMVHRSETYLPDYDETIPAYDEFIPAATYIRERRNYPVNTGRRA